MEAIPHRKHYDIVPTGELRCVWMNAGLLSYLLCDHGYDCEQCPLDAAMLKHYANHPKSEVASERSFVQPVPAPLHPECRFTEDHQWMLMTNLRTSRIGIEPELAAALLIPKAIVLPSVGQRVQANQPCVWIILEEGTFPIMAPASGEVVSRNSRLLTNPQDLFFHPFDEGWLFEMRIDRRSADLGMNVEQAQEIYASDARRFRESLNVALNQASVSIGETLADGGKPLRHVYDILGGKKYFAIVRQVFSSKRA